MGKGAAVQTAISYATGEFSLIQDADLEYDPREYRKLPAPLLSGEADVVYGSRFLHSGERRVLYFWHSLANKVLTTLCNIAADINLSDMETCYKAFRTSLLNNSHPQQALRHRARTDHQGGPAAGTYLRDRDQLSRAHLPTR